MIDRDNQREDARDNFRISEFMSQAVPPTLTAIVLAGGLSSRMGQDKALISVHGLPLLLRVCQVAKQTTDQVYVVTAWVERYRDLCAEANITLIAEVLQSGTPQGPICGFLQGLSQVQTDWVLLLACDLPNLRVEVLREWRWLLAETPPEVVALLPQSVDRWEPLCGFYRTDCRASLQAFTDHGGRSFQTWLNQQSVKALPVRSPSMLLNCNTPADLEQIDFRGEDADLV